eukprot:COSAG01_NODE_6634_length_3569_cov_1.447550_5_plen_273_part_00
MIAAKQMLMENLSGEGFGEVMSIERMPTLEEARSAVDEGLVGGTTAGRPQLHDPLPVGTAAADDAEQAAVAKVQERARLLATWKRSLPESKLRQYHNLFRKYDVDNGGSIGKEELVSLMEELGHKLDENESEAMMSQIDTDGSGEIDFDEFLQAVHGRATVSIRFLLTYKAEPGQGVASRVVKKLRLLLEPEQPKQDSAEQTGDATLDVIIASATLKAEQDDTAATSVKADKSQSWLEALGGQENISFRKEISLNPYAFFKLFISQWYLKKF